MSQSSGGGKKRLNTFEVLREELACLLTPAWPGRFLTPDADHSLGPPPPQTVPEDLRQLYDRIHALPKENKPTALCLSGGGIRSATFCLGVLQSLAETKQLGRFTYLSTVSGGGYIGSWLSCWATRVGWDTVELALDPQHQRAAEQSGSPAPVGTIEEAEADPLRRLRAYSNYLSPIWGLSLDGVTLVAIFLRNLTLNWLVWLPLLAGLVALPRAYVAALEFHPSAVWPSWLAIAGAGAVLGIGVAYIVCDLPGPPIDKDPPTPKPLFFWCCFVPISSCSVIASLCSAWVREPDTATLWKLVAGAIATYLIGVAVGVQWRFRKRMMKLRRLPLGALPVAVLCVVIGAGLLWLVTKYFRIDTDSEADDVLLYATLAVPLLLTVFWMTLALYAGFMRRWTDEQDREWWSRATAWWLFGSIAWLALFGVVFYLPTWLFDNLSTAIPAGAQLGVGGALLGIVTSAFGYWSKNGASLKTKAAKAIDTLGMRILDLLAFVVLVTIVVAVSILDGVVIERAASLCEAGCKMIGTTTLAAETNFVRQEAALAALAPNAAHAGAHASASQAYAYVFTHATFAPIFLAVVGLLLFAFLVSFLIGTNTFSLHALYGNRLIRAYLGTTRRERHPHWFTDFDPGDDCGIAKMRPPGHDGPMQLINIALNLVQASGTRLAWQQRKAASFIATPLHCGSDGVGYAKSTEYGGREGMTLGRAMTISGAAASPNMGYHSSKLVTMVMMLFNVRLGWWEPNPKDHETDWMRSEPRLGVWAMLEEGLGRTTDSRADIYLSDGGHFDNLGVYEMVRRRCHVVVAIDATADPHFAYRDLLDTCRKIRVDFGVSIELPPILPGPGRRTADRRRLIARIRYSMRDGSPKTEDGYLVVLKPVLIGDEAPGLIEYARTTKRKTNVFPHQSTADQFFDETQFESYRQLGYWSARRSLPADLDLVADLPRPADVGDLFGSTAAAGLGGLPPAATGAGAATSGLASSRAAAATAESARAASGLSGLGTATVLATALTVGGTVGVVGTLKLDSSELRLSDADRALIKDGMTLRYTGGPTSQGGDPSLAVLLSRIDTTLKDIGEAGKRLEPLDQVLVDLRSVVKDFDASMQTFGTQSTEQNRRMIEELKEAEKAIERLRRSSPDRGPPGTTGQQSPAGASIPDDKLNDIIETLHNIRVLLHESSPRRNIRGG